MSLKSGTLPTAQRWERKPKNHGLRYKHVGSITDTGASASKSRPQNSDRLVSLRRGELFKRVDPNSLEKFLREQFGAPLARVPEESVYAFADQTSQNFISNVVDSDVCGPRSDSLLILDVRDRDDFDKCHVEQAKSYPRQLISHDKISPELYVFKTNSNKRLVIYDTDDKSTAKVATVLVEKGFLNVYALSGGFEECRDSFPEILEGEIPTGAGGAGRHSARPGSSCSRFTASSTRRYYF